MAVADRAQIPALTGVRALFAASVLVFHLATFAVAYAPWIVVVWPVTDIGWIGVDGFFLLSGFVLAHNHGAGGWTWRRAAAFLRDRIARIYPVYLACTIAGAAILGAALLASRAEGYAVHLTFRAAIANLLLVQAWTIPAGPSYDPLAWSVSCEWLAYLAFPALAMGATRLQRPSLVLVGLGALLAAPALLALALDLSLGRMHLIRIAAEFPAGILLHRVASTVPPFPRGSSVAGAAFAGAVAAAGWGLHTGGGSAGLIGVPLLALGILALALTPPTSRGLSSRLAAYWGRASYPLYLVHGLVLMVMVGAIDPAKVPAGAAGSIAVLAVTLGIILAASAALHHAVEEPARRLLRTRRVPAGKDVLRDASATASVWKGV